VNRWGLAEMHGQLQEWCADQWHRDPVGGGSWINDPHTCRAAMRNSNQPDNDITNVGIRPGCFSPPAPFTIRAAGRDSSGSTRRVTDPRVPDPRVQTRSGDRRSPLARPAPSQRPHDPHSPGPLPHGPRDLGDSVGFPSSLSIHPSPGHGERRQLVAIAASVYTQLLTTRISETPGKII
jgi:hypothetical protein